MSFVAKLQRAREVLEQQGRLSVRALGRELALRGEHWEGYLATFLRRFGG